MISFIKKVLKTSNDSRQEKKLEAVQLYYVSWYSRHGQYSSDVNRQVEAFPSKEDAEVFKKDLENAFKLIRHTSGDTVRLEKR